MMKLVHPTVPPRARGASAPKRTPAQNSGKGPAAPPAKLEAVESLVDRSTAAAVGRVDTAGEAVAERVDEEAAAEGGVATAAA